jgi:hypothetical protein
VAESTRTCTGRGRGGADAHHLAALEHPQELGLQLDGQLAHLVEEDRAPFGGLEDAHAALAGAREGPALVAEEHALGEGAGDGRAVEHDEGPARVGRAVVQAPRGELLAGAGLALQEDGQVGAAEALERGEELAHGHVAAAQLAEGVEVGDVGLEGRVELDAGDGAAHFEGGPRRDDGLVEARAGVEGAVAARQVAHEDAVALVGGGELAVEGRHGGVGEAQIAARRAADDAARAGEHHLLARVGPGQHGHAYAAALGADEALGHDRAGVLDVLELRVPGHGAECAIACGSDTSLGWRGRAARQGRRGGSLPGL